MSHTTIYFLTSARDFDHAERTVTGYLEGETFFDYSETQTCLSGPLETKRNDIDAFLNGWDWKTAADALLRDAEAIRRKAIGGCTVTTLSAPGSCIRRV
jgi:hypothetical protein